MTGRVAGDDFDPVVAQLSVDDARPARTEQNVLKVAVHEHVVTDVRGQVDVVARLIPGQVADGGDFREGARRKVWKARASKVSDVTAPESLEVDEAELELEEPDYDYPDSIARYRGAPFTGVALERDQRSERRCEYVDGKRHGQYRVVALDGRLLGEGRYANGRPIGEHTGFWPNGSPRTFHRYGERGAVEVTRSYWADAALSYERTPESERTWYRGGALRSERREGVRWAYARDGRCAYGEGVQRAEQAHVYDHFRFFDEVMAEVCLELLDDYDFERGVWMWTHRRIDDRDPRILDDLRGFLAHPNLGARATALQIVGNRGLCELAPELRGMLADERVPPSVHGEYPGQGGRGHSFSLAKTARLMLDKLGC